ncbi:hypothetical protein D9M72_440980 [compost metagenome]
MGQQLAPERAAGVRAGEVFLTKAARIEHRHRQRIAERQRRGGAGRRRQVQRAGFFLDRRVQVDVGQLGQVGVGVAGDRDQPRANALDDRDDRQQLAGLARIGEGDQHVVARDHAQVAVAGLGRVHKERRRAGRGQRGRDLASDMAGLADA